MTLGNDARALLDAARAGDEPDASDAARVRAKLATRLGVAAGAVGAASSASAAASGGGAGVGAGITVKTGSAVGAASASTIGGAKLLIAFALAGGGAVAGWAAWPSAAPAVTAPAGVTPAATIGATPSANALREVTTSASAATTTVASTATTATTTIATATTTIATATTPSRAATIASTVPTSEPRAAGDETHVVRANAAGPVAPVPSATIDTVREEAALLGGANAALAANAPRAALARIEEHAARFPNGALGEEREAARVLALCALGRAAEARTLATAFVARNPRSPHLARVRRACGQ